MSLTLIQGSSFVSTGAGKAIPLPGSADYFRVVNLTQASTTQASGRGVEFEWYADRTPAGGAVVWKKADNTDALEMTVATSGGFTYVPASPSQGPQVTGTVISQAAAAVASVANASSSFSNGDRVRIYGVVGMRQISTMAFSVTDVTTSNMVLPGLNSSGFAAAASAFKVRKIAEFEEVLPEYLFITSISQAVQAVVGVSTYHDYVAGMKFRLDIPPAFGMQEANGLSVTIVSVGATSLTVDLDTSGFSSFAFPASATSVNLSRFATLAPDGQRAYYDQVTDVQYGYNIQQAPFRSVYGEPYMYLAAGVLSPAGSSGDVIEVQAFRYDG